MNLRHLHYFSTLAQCLHFGKAAKQLYITQPPLTRQIKDLEAELDVPLFNRNKRNVSLTPQGEFLLNESQKILRQIENMKHSIKLIDKGVVGQINIGYVGAAMHCVLPDILVKLRHNSPDVNTVLIEQNTERQVKAIMNGELDVGFVRTPVDLDDIVVKVVFEEKFALLLPVDSKVEDDPFVALRALAKEPFIAFSRECGPALVDSTINICNKCGFSPNIVHQSRQINAIVRLVESGLGYSIVPASVRHGYDLKVRFIELNDFKETAYLSMIYRQQDMKPILKNFVKLVGELYY